MKDNFNPMLDPLGATWAETIAALPTQEERDEATHFIEHDLRKGAGNGILRGMFLLLKANRCYLEKLPEKFNSELVKPMVENLRRIEARIALHSEMQDKMQTQMERCVTSAAKSADRMEAVIPRMEGVVQKAFDDIDTSKLTQKIEDTVTEGVVRPVAKVNAKCEQLQDKLDQRLPGLTDVLKWLTISNAIVWALGCALIIGAFAICSLVNIERDMVIQLQTRVREEIEKVHATAQVNEKTLDALAGLNVALEISPEKDWWGHEMPYHYCISIRGADSGGTFYKNWERYGAIYVHEEITPISLFHR